MKMAKEQNILDFLPGNLCEKVDGLSANQIFIAFGKFESGCRPGSEGWSKEDQQVLDALNGPERNRFTRPM